MQLSDEQRDQVGTIAERHRVKLALLFGSAVTEKRTHAGSDLDIAVMYEDEPADYREHGELARDFQKLFPNHEVDLASLHHADPLFLKKVTEECQLLYGDHRRLQELKIFAYKRFQDHRRYFEMERAYVDRFLKTMTPAK